MKSTSTNCTNRRIGKSAISATEEAFVDSPIHRFSDSYTPPSPRGTAEIETLLVMIIFISILMLAKGSHSLGGARLANVYNAENDAYSQVVAGRGLSPSANPLPIDGINAIRPALPNRFDLADEFKNVTVSGGDVPFTQTLNDRAIFLDPAWHYSSWPNTGDRPAIQQWFSDYVGESHPQNLVESLGLQPAGPP